MAQMMHNVFQIKYILIKSTCSQLSESEKPESIERSPGVEMTTIEYYGLPATKVIKTR